MSGDEFYMAQAIALAKKGWYTTHPNPRVGCVLVKDEHIIAQGWHQFAGQGHAEVNALADLKRSNGKASAEGATAYVTLEPCSHFGRTPPCSNALIEAGVKCVVIAMTDPNPLVAGNGIKRLQEHGLDVRVGVLETEAQALNPGFIQRMQTGKPLLRCKMAMSLDGRTAMANGESKWITAADARADVQRLRAESSAILTGIGTILADNPSMNVRSERFTAPDFIWTEGSIWAEGSICADGSILAKGSIESKTKRLRQPDRVILDTHLRIPLDAKLLSLQGQVVICTSEAAKSQVQKIQALEQKGVVIHFLNTEMVAAEERLSATELMKVLAECQYNEVLLEAGATLGGSLLKAAVVDELIIYMAAHLMGSEARGLFNIPELSQMSDRINLKIADIRAVGNDFRITAKVLPSSRTGSGEASEQTGM